MKKKIIGIMLTAALASTMIAGCSSGSGSSGSSSKADDTSASSASSETSGEASDESGASYEGTTISLLIDTDTTDAGVKAVAELAEEKLGITVEFEYRVGGSDGDNLVKTQLAAGEMADIMAYNSGALLSALNPSQYLYDISVDSNIIDRLDDTYLSAVTIDGATYGVPMSSTQAGCVMYNRDIYEQYNLEVPTTWDEFIANCETLKDAGEVAIIGSFADSWTS